MTEQFRLESLLLCRNRVFAVMTLLFLTFAGLAGWQGGQLARAHAAAIDAAMQMEVAHDGEALAKADRIKAEDLDPPWWQSPLNVQAWSYALIRHVSLPPRPLAGAAIADADLKPFLFRVNPHPPDRWSNRASELTPTVAAYGGLDLAELVLILTPLLIVVAFADVIRDRNGSQRQWLATVQSASETGLIAARLAPRALLVMIIVLFAAFFGLAATIPSLGADTATGALVITAAFLAHALFWIIVASALVLIVRRAVATFSAFVSLWFVFGVLAPLIVEAGARIAVPPPSPLVAFSEERAEVVAARMREDELTRAYAATDALARDMLLAALERDQLLITPTNLLVQREVDRRRASRRNTISEARERFEAQLTMLTSLSPTLTARAVVYEVAGRGAQRRAEFEAQVHAYYADLQRTFVPLLMRRATLDEVLLPKPFVFVESTE